MGVSIRLDANIHPAPLDHHAVIIRRLNCPTESKKRKVAGAAVIVLAVDPFAVKGLRLGFGKPHLYTSSLTVASRRTSLTMSATSAL